MPTRSSKEKRQRVGMSIAKTMNIGVSWLLENTDFLRYVLESDCEQQRYWDSFAKEHPQCQPAIDQAKYILQHLDTPSDFLTREEIENLKRRIKTTLSV